MDDHLDPLTKFILPSGELFFCEEDWSDVHVTSQEEALFCMLGYSHIAIWTGDSSYEVSNVTSRWQGLSASSYGENSKFFQGSFG